MKLVRPLVLALLLTSCVSGRGQALGPVRHPARAVDHPIAFYELAEDAGRPFEKVALVTIEGAPAASWESMHRELVRRARKLGGDAVVLRGEERRAVSSLTIGTKQPGLFTNLLFSSKELGALVIRFVDGDGASAGT